MRERESEFMNLMYFRYTQVLSTYAVYLFKQDSGNQLNKITVIWLCVFKKIFSSKTKTLIE